MGSERAPAGVRSERWAPALASILGLLIVAATLEIVLDSAIGHSPLVPEQPAIAGWLAGIGERLGFRVFLIALLVCCGAYIGLLALAHRRGGEAVSKRLAIALIAIVHLIVFIGPVLISTDVFSYIAYARMGVEHGINPYLQGPASIAGDPVFRYVGHDWRETATAYGPVYTLLSYPLAPLGVEGALWAMKLEALLASARRCARLALCEGAAARPGLRDRWRSGMNPLYFIYGLGGAHNDLIMLAAMMWRGQPDADRGPRAPGAKARRRRSS